MRWAETVEKEERAEKERKREVTTTKTDCNDVHDYSRVSVANSIESQRTIYSSV